MFQIKPVTIQRKTRESSIRTTIEGGERSPDFKKNIQTQIHFLNHMIEQWAWRSCLNLSANVELDEFVLQHVIAEDIEENVCTLLGHPSQCPHGRPIPPGLCCERRDSTIASIFLPVTELDIGESAIISYISSNDNRQMDKLLAFGILPGNSVKLHQIMPLNGPVVIQIDQTQVALERDVAEQICVRRGKRPSNMG